MTLKVPGAQWTRDVNLDDFDSQVLSCPEQLPVLVDFWAEWCSPCLAIAPLLAQIVEEHAGELTLARVEVDSGENMKLAGRYRVRGFPTLILFRQGEEQGRFSGAKPASWIRAFLQQHSGL